MKKTHLTLISLLGLFLFSLLFYFPLLFQGKMYTTQDWGRGDLTHFNYPLHHIYGNAIKNFSFPFWTDEIYTGFAMGAEGQVGMFYLPNIILFFLFSNYTAFALSFFVISLLATTGMYVFAKLLRMNNTSSVFAAITFGYSMFFAGHFVHLNMIQAFSLVPWFFVLVEHAIQKKFYWYLFLLFSLLEQQMLFIGHPQIALYTTTVIIFYTYFRTPKQKRTRTTLLTILGVICGGILASVQLLPTWELGKISPSTTMESAENTIMMFPYTLRDFLYFFVPSPFGNPSNNTYTILLKDGIYWENNTYSGILATIFFIVLLFSKQRKQIKLFIIFFAMLLVFATGWIYIFDYLPPYSFFRLPQRSLILCLFFFSVLAAYGFEYVIKRFSRFGTKLMYVGWGIIILQFINLAFIANTYNNPIPKEQWLAMPQTSQYLKDKEGRIYSIGGVSLWENVYKNFAHGWQGNGGADLITTDAMLDPNRNATYGDIPSIDGYAKLVPLRTLAYLSLIRNGVHEEGSAIQISSTSAKLLGLSNVKTLVTAKPITNSDFQQIQSFYDTSINTTFYLYNNPYYQPLIRSITTLSHLPKTGNIKATNIITDDWNHEAFGEDKANDEIFNNDVLVSNQKQLPGMISFTVNNNSDAFIVVSESYDKNWEVSINGVKTPVLPININSMGIKVSKGNNTVQFSYIPKPYITGGLISIIGAVITVITCFAIKKYGMA